MKGRSAIAIICSVVCAAGTMFGAAVVQAAVTPTLSLSSAGGDAVTVSVSADPNASVMFYYNVGSSSGMQVTTLGTTNSSGYFTETINASSYGINAGEQVYAIVDGAQSALQIWPAVTGTPTLSQTNVTIGLGQSTTLYSTGSSAAVYMANNSSPLVASIQTNGTQVTVTAEQTGSTTASICYSGSASSCVNLYVTVQTGSVLSFSANNLTVAIGQGTTVNVTGGSGAYSISSNSNPGSVSAVLSGSVITLTAETSGSANVTVCDTSGNCGTLYVTAGATSSTGSIYFSTSNPSIAVGQSLSVTIYGGSGYYVTGNSNASVVSQSVNGSALTIAGLEPGASTITVCSASNGCGSLYVTVGSSATSGTVTFGIANPTIVVGQSLSVSVSGGSGYYISSNTNSNVVQASVNGTSLYLYAANAGSASVTVCATNGSCNVLSVNISATSVPVTTTTSGTTASSLLSAIQSMQSQLAALVTQIQTMVSTLNQLAASAGVSTGGTTTSGATVTTPTTALYDFTEFLSEGSEDAQVTELQQYLTTKGFYSGPVTGFYGTLTAEAVGKYQSAHGIDPLGYVGPSTRAALNAGE